MVTAVRVAIIGAPVACSDGVKDAWQEIARWIAGQLRRRYGDSVGVEYHDLFDPDCPPVPPDSQLPLVIVNDEVLTSGGKLSLPLIRRAAEALGARPVGPDHVSPFEDGVSARATRDRSGSMRSVSEGGRR